MLFASPRWDVPVYWALDLETGGLDARKDPIISVGMVPVRGGVIRLGEAFLRSLVRQALEFRPPPLLVLRLRGGGSELDLKRQGIAPVVFLARCYGLAVGSHARNTLERLQAATRAGIMGVDASGTVSEAYRFLLGLRLRSQLKMISEGKTPSNVVSLSQLSAIERSRLKDSLRAIGSWQGKAAYRYQAG